MLLTHTYLLTFTLFPHISVVSGLPPPKIFHPKFFYILTQKHNAFVFQDSLSCLFPQPCVSFFSPCQLFIEGSDLSQLLSGLCHAVLSTCVCVWVCHAAGLHKLLYQPSSTLLSRLPLSPFIFPILSHTGPHMLLSNSPFALFPLSLSLSLFINVHTIQAH